MAPQAPRLAAGESRERDFSHEVYSAMNGCLGCRACASNCPLKVDQPQLKARFIELYHRGRPPALRDYLIAGFEHVVPWLARMPSLANSCLSVGFVRWALHKSTGFVRIPLVSRKSLRRELRHRKAAVCAPQSFDRTPSENPNRVVWIVQDVFTSFYETEVVLAVFELLRELGFEPHVLPYRPNGRALLTKGFAKLFRQTARRSAMMLSDASALGNPLLGIDPAVTLSYRDSYPAGAIEHGFRVLLLEEWLSTERETVRLRLGQLGYRPPHERGCWLLPHCTEREATTGSQQLWRQAFDLFGLELDLCGSGCCRKSTGSECEVRQMESSGSVTVTNWHTLLPSDPERSNRYMATGYSCRGQIARSAGAAVRHPAQVLLEILREHRANPGA